MEYKTKRKIRKTLLIGISILAVLLLLAVAVYKPEQQKEQGSENKGVEYLDHNNDSDDDDKEVKTVDSFPNPFTDGFNLSKEEMSKIVKGNQQGQKIFTFDDACRTCEKASFIISAAKAEKNFCDTQCHDFHGLEEDHYECNGDDLICYCK